MAPAREDRDLDLLLKRARGGGGDPQALNELLARCRPRLRRLLARRCRGLPAASALAEDLTQQSLGRIAQHLDQCRARTAAGFWSWCRTVALNELRDWTRQHAGKRRRTISASGDGGSGSRPIAAGARGQGKRSERPRAAGLLQELLADAMQQLSAGTQTVVRERLRGATWREAAEEAGTTRGGARSRWRRAMDRLEREVKRRLRQLPRPQRNELRRHTGL